MLKLKDVLTPQNDSYKLKRLHGKRPLALDPPIITGPLYQRYSTTRKLIEKLEKKAEFSEALNKLSWLSEHKKSLAKKLENITKKAASFPIEKLKTLKASTILKNMKIG